jgi:hypothetical protein
MGMGTILYYTIPKVRLCIMTDRIGAEVHDRYRPFVPALWLSRIGL